MSLVAQALWETAYLSIYTEYEGIADKPLARRRNHRELHVVRRDARPWDWSALGLQASGSRPRRFAAWLLTLQSRPEICRP